MRLKRKSTDDLSLPPMTRFREKSNSRYFKGDKLLFSPLKCGTEGCDGKVIAVIDWKTFCEKCFEKFRRESADPIWRKDQPTKKK